MSTLPSSLCAWPTHNSYLVTLTACYLSNYFSCSLPCAQNLIAISYLIVTNTVFTLDSM